MQFAANVVVLAAQCALLAAAASESAAAAAATSSLDLIQPNGKPCLQIREGQPDSVKDASLTITRSPPGATAVVPQTSTTPLPPIRRPAPRCVHTTAAAANPQHLCPELLREGWCACGPDGTYAQLPDGKGCDFPRTGLLPTSLSVRLTSCGAAIPTSRPPVPRTGEAAGAETTTTTAA